MNFQCESVYHDGNGGRWDCTLDILHLGPHECWTDIEEDGVLDMGEQWDRVVRPS